MAREEVEGLRRQRAGSLISVRLEMSKDKDGESDGAGRLRVADGVSGSLRAQPQPFPARLFLSHITPITPEGHLAAIQLTILRMQGRHGNHIFISLRQGEGSGIRLRGNRPAACKTSPGLDFLLSPVAPSPLGSPPGLFQVPFHPLSHGGCVGVGGVWEFVSEMDHQGKIQTICPFNKYLLRAYRVAGIVLAPAI